MTVWLLQCRTLLPSKSESVGFTTEDGLLRGLAGLFSWAWVLRVFSWEGFGEMVFISWGREFCRGLCLQWDLPSATGSNSPQPWVRHSDWADWAQVEKGEQQGVRAGGVSGPCQISSLESDREQNRGILEVSHDSLAALSAASILWIPSKPQLLLHAKGCASLGIAFLTVRILVLFLPQIFCLGMSSYTGIVLRRLIHWPPTSFNLPLADVHLAIGNPLDGPQCCSWWSRLSF